MATQTESLCPDSERLLALHQGTIASSEIDALSTHLQKCPSCQVRLRDIADQDNTRPIPTPPPGKSSQAIQAGVSPRFPGAGGSYPFLQPPGESDEIGRLGNYRVLKLLGKGGMAFVFKAEDLTLRRGVALKVMKPDLSADADAWPRFLREARAMAAIKHDHLVTVYQVGQEAGVIYLAMDLLQGESLEDWLTSRGVPKVSEIVRIGKEMASGLEIIHRHGLIHRDIKPANIWLEEPGARVKILDFGLARLVDDDAHLTQTGTVIGTPAFMSPEQASGEKVDARSDLFSLGSVIYCLCTGKKPFPGETTMAVLTALAVAVPKPIREINSAVPQPLADLVMELLAKSPAKRPPSAAEVVARLKDAATWVDETLERPIQASPIKAASSSTHVLKEADAPIPPSARKGGSDGEGRIPLVPLVGAVVLALIVGFAGFKFFARPNTTVAPTQPVSTEPIAKGPGEKTPVEQPPIPAGKRVYLTDLREIAVENWPFIGIIPGPPPAPGEDPGPPPARGTMAVRVDRKRSPHGIFMHAAMPPAPKSDIASVTYKLDKQFSTFGCEVGLNDGPPECEPMIFVVYADGKEIWRSKGVTQPGVKQTCKLPVKDVSTLKLEVQFADPRGAHAAWIEPYLEK